MKTNKLVKFSLTVVCAAVLAACGSSGGGDDTPAKPPVVKPDTGKPDANKPNTGKPDANKPDAGKPNVKPEEPAQDGYPIYGGKFAKKMQSNLDVGEGNETNNKSSTKITDMTVELHPSLDTIVVAVGEKQSYLEDFDFRGNVSNASGEHQLEHIYKTPNGSTLVGAARNGGASETKTDSKGVDVGKAFVYEEGRLNYTRHQEGEHVVDPKEARTDERLKTSVAEVYGLKTFLAGDSESANNKTLADADLANLPLAKKNADGRYVDGDKLNHVQYGRVTSKLHALDEKLSSLKDGKKVIDKGTKVASYAEHGTRGSEDNYFFRGDKGVDLDAKALQARYFAPNQAGGVLEYRGHAVTYNLDRDLTDVNGVPNAIGVTYQLESGTHVKANVDLGTKKVTGNLYDQWSVSLADKAKEYKTVELAKFEGTLDKAAHIKGNSTRSKDNAEGMLKASLFGKNAEELGGAIASKDTANNWGASFGAKLQNNPYVAPAPKPEPKPTPGIHESTDQNNKD